MQIEFVCAGCGESCLICDLETEVTLTHCTECANKRIHELQRKYDALVDGVRKLSNEWKSEAMSAVPPEYANRKLDYKYLRGDNYAGGRYDSAEELRALMEDDDE